VTPAGAVLLAGLALLAVQVGRLAGRWRRGGPASVEWGKGLAGLPRAYLQVVHEVVARDPASARMHALAAGGLLGALALSLPVQILGLWPRLLAFPIVLLAVLGLVGSAIARRRRTGPQPDGHRLSAGRYARLPLALAATVLFLPAAALLAAAGDRAGLLWLPVTALGAAGMLWLAWQGHGGPMRHALAGAAHLAAHPRPLRTRGLRDTALAPLPLDDESSPLGAGTPRDFAWNRLLSFDACVQCGRCEAVCPAFAAGQPLNPKALVNDLVRSIGPGVAVPYEGDPHPGLPVAGLADVSHLPLVAAPGGEAVIQAETLWSCTTCRACVEECPMLIEHVDAVVDLRRHATLELGAVPARVAEALTELRDSDTQSGRALSERSNWAIGRDLREIGSTGEAEVLLWQGEAAYQPHGQRVLLQLLALMQAAKVDVAVLGAEERDCGELSRRAGDEAGFQRLARENVAALAKYRFGRIVTADPHAFHMLSREYPAFGGTYLVEHHSQFLDRLLAEGRLPQPAGDTPAGRVAWHDPCYLGRYGGEIAAPRRLLDRLGVARVEMARYGFQAMCCGGGGGAPLSDVPGRRRIPDLRMEQAQESGAEVVAVGCPNCMAMLDGVPGRRPEVLDIAELVANRCGVTA
jgi:Fe-S oxidoreductase